jgi:hypothetical protein
MPVVDTTTPFSNNEQITSTKLNNIMDNSFFVSGAVVPSQGLQVTSGGQLQVPNSGITTALLENSSTTSNGVTAAKIANGAVITEKISDSAITTIKLANSTSSTTGVTTAKIADSNVTTAKLANASVVAEKLSGAQTGSAPIYGCRAWASVNSTGTTKRSQNIQSITKPSTGNYTVNFSLDMSPNTYAIVTTTESTGSSDTFHAEFYDKSSGSFKIRTSKRDTSGDRTSVDADFDFMVLG